MTGSDQLRLDAAAVERFLATVPALRPLVSRLETGARPGESLTDGLARDDQKRAEVARFLAARGYSSIENWDQTVRAIALAYGYADPSTGLASLPDTLRTALADVRADRTLSEEEKRESIAELEAEIEAAERMIPPPENVEAIRPYMARLRAILTVD